MDNLLKEIDISITHQNFNNCKYITKEAQPYFDYSPYYRWLWAAMEVIQPKNVVELGTYWGLSGLAIMEGLPEDSKFTTVDTDHKHHFLDHIRDDRLNFIIESSFDAYKYFNNIDFLFIDTLHNYNQISNEWRLYNSLMSEDSFIILDDIHINDEMSLFWNELQNNKIDITQYHASGFGIVDTRRGGLVVQPVS